MYPGVAVSESTQNGSVKGPIFHRFLTGAYCQGYSDQMYFAHHLLNSTMSSTQYSDRRTRVYEDCFNEYRAQYINYQKYYFAANALSNAHSALNIYGTVAGAGLLVLIAWIFRAAEPGVWTPISLIISASISVSSFISFSVDWEERSEIYYREGQKHQNLFKKFNYLVKIRIPDPSENDSDLEDRHEELIDEKNELNMDTSQLAQFWYKLLAFRKDLDWSRPPLHKLR